MSRYRPETVRCACGAARTERVAESINVTRTPAARAAILAGTFHTFDCAACGGIRVYRGPWLYTDVERHQMISVRPPEDAPAWRDWETVAERAFWRQYPRGGQSWRADADDYRLRLVFGQWALREKLLLWDAGIDDARVEVLKLELRLSGTVAGLPVVVGVAPDALFMRVLDSDARVEVPRSVLDRWSPAALRGRYPALFDRLYVDHRRVALPGVLAALEEGP